MRNQINIQTIDSFELLEFETADCMQKYNSLFTFTVFTFIFCFIIIIQMNFQVYIFSFEKCHTCLLFTQISLNYLPPQ